MTLLELAYKVLKKTKRPMNNREIWEYGKRHGFFKESDFQGQTPWSSLGAQIYVNMKNNKDCVFAITETRPRRFLLKSWGNYKKRPGDSHKNDIKRNKHISQQQLVMEYAENLSSELFYTNKEVILNFIKGKQGIYALYHGNRLFYVGLASYMHIRLKQHLNDRLADKWDRFSIYLTKNTEYLKEMESLVLRIAHPVGNKAGGKFVAAKHLMSEIKQYYFEQKTKEAHKLFGDAYSEKKKTDKKVKQEGTSKLTMTKIPIKMTYKGNVHQGYYFPSGQVKTHNTMYNSPTAAALSNMPGRPAVNGWIKWKYKDQSGKWILLDNLRKK